MDKMNLSEVTLEDCVTAYLFRGIETIINDGVVTGFTNFFDCNPLGYTE